jgi:CBS-domain-containing membrane protein
MIDSPIPATRRAVRTKYPRPRGRARGRIRQSRLYRKARYIIYRETIVKPADLWWAFIGSFLGISTIGLMGEYLRDLAYTDKVFLIGSFGASAVLVYAAANSPLAQPRNVMGGHLLGALVGVTTAQLVGAPELLWLGAALAVSSSIVAMIVTKTLHPPGGATALLAVIGSEQIKAMGYLYVLFPVLTGVVILVGIALVVNNIPPRRCYPYRR